MLRKAMLAITIAALAAGVSLVVQPQPGEWRATGKGTWHGGNAREIWLYSEDSEMWFSFTVLDDGGVYYWEDEVLKSEMKVGVNGASIIRYNT